MFIRHRAQRHALVVIMQRAGQRVLDDLQPRHAVFLGKTPDLAPAGDRRLVVEIHLHREIARLALVCREHAGSALLIIAEARRIGHFHPLVVGQVAGRGVQRLGHGGADRGGIGLVGDDQIFPPHETERPARIARAEQRHRRRGQDVVAVHGMYSASMVLAATLWRSHVISPRFSIAWRRSSSPVRQ